MVNFMGEKQRTTDFHDVETSIYGENGLGKTRHFNAFMWLLFGKDVQDRKDFNIKSIVNGQPLKKVDSEVSGILNVDGEDIKLRRVYTEKYVKPRGQIEEVFKGNETEVYWNDVPLKVGEYQSRINEIINDSVFKMVTNPMYFPQLKWQDQREQLFMLAGTITDAEIAARKPEYQALLNKITGKSMADFKREIAAKKRNLKEDLEKVQPRIDQTYRLMPKDIDFVTIEKNIAILDTQLSDIDKSIADKTTAIRQQYEGVQAKQREINELKQKQQKLVHDAKTQASEAAFEANSARRNLESNIKIAESELSNLNRSVQLTEKELADLQKRLETTNQEIIDLRAKWHEENEKEYCGDDNCYACGQLLPEEKRTDARKIFSDSKDKTLGSINDNGVALSNKVNEIEQDIENAQNQLNKAIEERNIKQTEIDSLKKQLSEMPVVGEQVIKGEELPEYTNLQAEIEKIEATLDDGVQKIDTSELQAQKKEISSKRDELKSELQKRDLIESYTKEIKELEAKGKDLAQQIADVEKEEYIIQNFTKEKIDECERRINGLFSLVTFKLFDYTIDGNESETCVPLVDGVPFGSVNTAGRINAGLDIINALTKFYGVSAPIFIDGRESINKLIDTESQIINLIVSKDKELVIE